MDIVIEGQSKPRTKSVPKVVPVSSVSATQINKPKTSTPAPKKTQKELDEINELVSIVDRAAPKKKVIVKRVVKKVKKPTTTEIKPAQVEEPTTLFPIIEDLPTKKVATPPRIKEVSTTITQPKTKNPFSFYNYDDSSSNNELPTLPDSDDDDGYPSPPEDNEEQPPNHSPPDLYPSNSNLFHKNKSVSSAFELPEVPDEDDSSEDELSINHLPSLMNKDTGSPAWKERALKAEKDANKWKSEYLTIQQQLINSENEVKKLRAKEKADAEQMEKIVYQVEQNLKQSKQSYEIRLQNLKAELDNTKLMLQHVTQNGDIDIPKNFAEYHAFMSYGKDTAKYSANQLKTLAESAETNLKNLLQGCSVLKDLSNMLSEIDKFAEKPVV